MISINKLLGIYCNQLMTVGFEKIKKNVLGSGNNFPVIKAKDMLNLDELLTP